MLKSNIDYNEILKYIKQDDNICIFCKNMCTTNSSCSDRYFQMQGTFEHDFDKIKLIANSDDLEAFYEFIYTASLCDKCLDIYEDDVQDGKKILFQDKGIFVIDCLYRMNN
jgi:hypothetical protein